MTGAPSILVTGATGYLGTQIVSRLGNQDIPFLATARKQGDQILACDLENGDAVREVTSKFAIDTAIHTAACVPKTSNDYADTEAAGRSLKMVENLAGSGIKRIVFTSSMTVYSDAAKMPVREDEVHMADKGYGAGKRKAELALMAQQKLSVIVLRLPGLFGPPRRGGILYNVARALSTGEAPSLPVDPPLWAALHVDDAADLCVRAALQNKGESRILNAGYPGVFSLTSAINAVAEKFGRPSLCSNPSVNFEMDISRLKAELELPDFSFDARLNELVEWAQTEAARAATG